jgi:hypothetical protein
VDKYREVESTRSCQIKPEDSHKPRETKITKLLTVAHNHNNNSYTRKKERLKDHPIPIQNKQTRSLKFNPARQMLN